MSVILYEYREFEGVYNQLVEIPKLKDVVMNNDYVNEYNSRQMPIQMKYNFENVLGRLLWYMYVANRVAYSLQYQRNEDIFTPEEKAEKYTLDEAKQKFGSFMYNIYTNNGTVFLSKDWLGLAMDIKKFIYPKDFEKGGEVIEYSKVYEILKDKIDDSVEDIESTYGNASETKGEEVEYKSRDGFIPFTDGGYSSRWFEYNFYLESEGTDLPTKTLDDKIEEFRERNREYALERFEEEYPEIVKELGGINNVDYSSLTDAGYDSEADDLDEFERDDEDSIMMEVEAFYYTPNNDRGEDGKHTIQLSGVVNLEAPYHRSGNLEDYIEERITFDSYKELEDKLDKGLAKVVSWFEGDMYDKNPRELKIRRMEKGGKINSVHAVHIKDNMSLLNASKKYSNVKMGRVPIGSLVGQTYVTIDGKRQNLFVGDKYIAKNKQIIEVYKPSKGLYMRLEAGGTLPTPFGQAGLVGETGAMNEMDMFAMGGGLPQGVQQYYANTYNPAYPTPHGYAKGGKMKQGYNDRLDESLGNRNSVEPLMMQSYKDRRDESKGMEKSMGRRAYQSVGTMDKMAKGGKVRKSPFKVGDMVYSYQNPNHKMRVSFVEDRGVEDGIDYGWGYKVALKTDEDGKYDPKGKYSQSSKWMSQNSVSKTKKTKYAKGGKTQGYNDKLDESLGNTKGKRSTKEQNYKDRRNESEAMEKKGGKRKYARVKTMDKGNRSKRKTPMTLAKEIRKEGEKWQDAVKRASAMLKKK